MARWLPVQDWAIGMCAGRSPFDLGPAPGTANPVLTRRSVDDVRAGFVADPFLVEAGGAWHVFFEVFDLDRGKGEIAHADSPDGRSWSYRGVVLREPFHLSYPFVFEWDGAHFMIPETLGAGEVRLYEAAPFPGTWRPAARLVAGNLADPTLLHHDGHWWLFGCGRHRHNDDLRLYHSPSPTGRWAEHPASPVVRGDPSRARPGGRPVVAGGTVVRFGQDCSAGYGAGVRAVPVTELTVDRYAERPGVTPFTGPPEPWSAGATHHVDVGARPDGTWFGCFDGRPAAPVAG
jgi:hypothetical protein